MMYQPFSIISLFNFSGHRDLTYENYQCVMSTICRGLHAHCVYMHLVELFHLSVLSRVSLCAVTVRLD